MKKILEYIAKNFDKIYIISLFVIGYFIVVAIFPGEGKFKYEYRNGQPWMHKDLIAPFNFAIYKLNNELEAEKKEALKGFAPIFTRDNKTGILHIEKFKKDFGSKWQLWIIEHDSLRKQNLLSKTIVYNKDSVKSYFQKTVQLFDFIYQNGIIENEGIDENSDSLPDIIRVINDKIATETNSSSVFTAKSAYEFLIQNLYNKAGNNKSNSNLEFVTSMQLNKYLVPNLIFDSQTTAKAKIDLFEELSTTKGIVIEGERIISRGEMIDVDKLRKIESLKKEFTTSFDSATNQTVRLLGRLIIVFFGFVIVFLFLKRFREYVLESRRKTIFILFLIVFFQLTTFFVYNTDVISIYIIPFIIVPILITTFYETRLALFIHLVTVLLAGFYAPNSFEFIFIQFFAGMIAIIGLKKIQKRSQFFKATMLSVLSYFVLYYGFAANQNGDLRGIEWINFAWFAGNGILVLLSLPMVYIFEKLFVFVSDITLLELSDSNQKLLRELAEKAPGTFQHSLQVANLAEEVVREIGGNTLLVRTGALYHDIGKLSNPQYFTENQVTGMNPHNDFKLIESASIIISHVNFGLEMAKKEAIPASIIDFIVTHHGTTKAEYFYRLYKKEFPEDTSSDSLFTYPGPKPSSKEMAILMMCDAIEAASRSLKNFDKQSLNNLVDNIIDYQIKEKQFDDSPISFAEINVAKRVIKNKLHNIYHARIEYPKP
jgi:putative nucleotidyltransferase with HDIG domain